jgi:flagellar biosynthesis GTPase FlhF
VLTKLDETSTFGSVFNAAWRSHLPLAYFTAGPRILDDFQPAHAGTLINALWHERWTA